MPVSVIDSRYTTNSSINLDEIPEDLRLLPPAPPLIRRALPDGGFDEGEGTILPRVRIRRADTWDRVSTEYLVA